MFFSFQPLRESSASYVNFDKNYLHEEERKKFRVYFYARLD